MDQTVSWPLLPDEFIITTLFTMRRKTLQKSNGLCRFDKVMPEGHIHLTAFQNVLLTW